MGFQSHDQSTQGQVGIPSPESAAGPVLQSHLTAAEAESQARQASDEKLIPTATAQHRLQKKEHAAPRLTCPGNREYSLSSDKSTGT